MRARAPGKLVLTGAYAVLVGAPAVVVAVDRHAVADASRAARSSPAEVDVAFGDEPAPHLDLSALQDADGRKLGLGSSAAAVVAALGARALRQGQHLLDPTVRAWIFRAAREAHARVQAGGSGVDIAASVYGGALRYQLDAGDVAIRRLRFPSSLVLETYASDHSARTSDLRARVDAARRRSPADAAPIADGMASVAGAAAEAFARGDAAAFVAAARDYQELLARLGALAGAAIVPAGWDGLAERATAERGAFLPSGAGGGDVAVWLGPQAASPDFRARAAGLGLRLLDLHVDGAGVAADAMDFASHAAPGSGPDAVTS